MYLFLHINWRITISSSFDLFSLEAVMTRTSTGDRLTDGVTRTSNCGCEMSSFCPVWKSP
ncbi:hypothetical protein CY34DRAFT_811865 [Suillus luteus UH-Slu-Lm8-n1]|uniref:Unplaced genomic scaffold CY34scaffold_456, whole genome shotgun sequence n=1 Tax=Suillus luteus UH-Slu-Lm8-n1 TaxID=930992 RepID=A0A0D0AV88_9AGAM|nr:hypothetical protein CY34DRAFT_811865 [Suillus luteus UH-Slu-Lm8-n1]